MMRPLVSVVMPVFNGEDYLKLAIDSILCQSLKEIEFIIVDDGSNDSTSQILLAYCDQRLTVISQNHRGIPFALNSGLKIAKGKYVARQDADDISILNRLEKQITFLEENPEIGLLGSFVSIIDKTGKEIKSIELPTDDVAIKAAIINENPFIHGATIYRKECVYRVGGYREIFFLSQDYDLWLRIAENYSVANYPLFLYKYRKNIKSVSYQYAEKKNAYMIAARVLANQRNVEGLDCLMKGDESYFRMFIQSMTKRVN
jgi:glycosyltransferase involved in cell wall biosynthesis